MVLLELGLVLGGLQALLYYRLRAESSHRRFNPLQGARHAFYKKLIDCFGFVVQLFPEAMHTISQLSARMLVFAS
jgi:hypothetical protein